MYDYVCYNVVFVGGYCGHSLRGLCGLKCPYGGLSLIMSGSQPARAVWIEIRLSILLFRLLMVTACEGCVDWNFMGLLSKHIFDGHSLRGLCGLKSFSIRRTSSASMSQPARAVWIEIDLKAAALLLPVVTACEGCVDWNPTAHEQTKLSICHSLRGLCGLKYSRGGSSVSIM